MSSSRSAARSARRRSGSTRSACLPGIEGFEHDETETGHEEVYIVLDGDGTFTVDGDAVAVVTGDYLRVDAEAVRKVVAGEDGLTFVVVAARPQAEYDGRPSL